MRRKSWCWTIIALAAGQLTFCWAESALAEAPGRESAPATRRGRAAKSSSGDDGPLPLAIRWWGQACVSIETFWGFKIVVDPYPANERLGYPKLDLSADVVLLTHEHFDHTGFESIRGEPAVLHGLTPDGNWADIDHDLDRLPSQPDPRLAAKAGAGVLSPHGVHIKGIRTYHDRMSGAERGKNTMFLIEADGVRILHCGDLGHPLTAEQVETIGSVDYLLIPVGGTYTIDAAEALAVSGQLEPRRFIWPIHFKTSAVEIPLATLDPFLTRARQARMAVREVKGNTIAATRQPTRQVTDTVPPVVIVSDFKPVRSATGAENALKAMRVNRRAFINVLGKMSKTQLDHRPSDGTHTIRWNFEHTTGRELGFFSQVYHALDPEIPVIDWNPAQMPSQFEPRHPEWDTAEMVRHVGRVAAFTERFSYLLADTPPGMKIEGTHFSARSLSKLMVGHYRNHKAKAVRKFRLPDWPER